MLCVVAFADHGNVSAAGRCRGLVPGGQEGYADFKGFRSFACVFDDIGHGSAGLHKAGQAALVEQSVHGIRGAGRYEGGSPAFVNPFAPGGQGLEHGAVFQRGNGQAVFGEDVGTKLHQHVLDKPGRIVQKLEAVYIGLAVCAYFRQLLAGGDQLINGRGGSQTSRVPHGFIIIEHGGGADIGQRNQLSVLIIGVGQQDLGKIVQVEIALFHIGAKIR
ncbi:hypothetical protein SDC9_133951 [bioreactor metagenome]|uniref:Uncharacterized protein n=1 Tax=bioreactor metagenome TaxID=1076179 RepID=A0A645DCB2_9ZZZZ